ncbi:15215_t:CDS:2, partial [Rhizophagus irregularis]
PPENLIHIIVEVPDIASDASHTIRGSLALLTDFVELPLESWISDNGNIDDYTIFQIILDLLSCLKKIHTYGYTHGDQEIIQDYNGLCQIIGIIKFEKKMSFSELIDKLKGKLKSFVIFVEGGKQLIKKKSI